SGALTSAAPLQTGLVTNATASITSPPEITITSAGHGLANGQQVTLQGVGGTTNANNTFFIHNVTANTFDLVGSTFGPAAYSANTGTWAAVPGVITNVTGAGSVPITVTSPNHGLVTGQRVTIKNVGGFADANGTFFITRIDPNTFSLNGTSSPGA